jgi:hypothetical protein
MAQGSDQVLALGTFQSLINESASGLDTPSANAQFNAAIQELGIADDSQLARFLWELINDSQSVTWQNIQSAGATSWAVIQATADGGWTVINSSESADWTDVNTSAGTNWQKIPTQT